MDLRDFITHNDVSDLEIRGSVRVQARLLWTVKKTVHTFRFLRVYLGKRTELEPLHEQQTSHITLLLYDIAAENPNLPKPGDIISFDPSKLRIYRNCCQVDTNPRHVVPVTPA
ncbi:Myosin-I heavy chain [Phytophthora cinnamomi]|uniref:Myosin-I heavy chain n=1 Tax=Phytophthora cinnamomi TaxID=4785 RepID=UPI00355AB4CC|nr:Myosin-I heavy chain [Phytophthora cinnamomi]